MTDAIVISHCFDGNWPLAGDHLVDRWTAAAGRPTAIRLDPGDDRPVAAVVPPTTRRLACLGMPLTVADLAALPELRTVFIEGAPAEVAASCAARGIAIVGPRNEGFWGQSVAECALGLTICGLRRLPQLHHAILSDASPWNFAPAGGIGRPGQRGHQYGDDSAFANGTICGKRVRIVGMGNIGARFAQWCAMLGADVAAYDPIAADPVFHRCTTRRVTSLDRLVADADILAPMMPLRPATTGMVTAAHVDALPRGALVVLVTRAEIVDTRALRRRILAGDLALAADVFDVEPLPPGDPLLGHPQVVHTPHLAGRTAHANHAYAEEILEAILG
jgi:phosphoglycerate dehydrogenase-like enzyme